MANRDSTDSPAKTAARSIPLTDPRPARREQDARRSPSPGLFARGWAVCVLAVSALLLFSSCAQDPKARLKAQRPQAAQGRALGEVMERFPAFSKVTWSSYPGPRGSGWVMARTQGIVNPDALVGKTADARVFSPRDKAMLDSAKAHLVFALEYAFSREFPEGRPTRMDIMLTGMGWDRSVELPNDTILAEIARGQPGANLIQAALDAADYCRTLDSFPERE